MHLKPLSSQSQRQIYVGRSSTFDTGYDKGAAFICNVRPNDHRNFASLITMIDQLLPLVTDKKRAKLINVESYLVDTGQVESKNGVSKHWRLMSDNITHAIMRRISRESVYTAKVIDSAAKLLNECFIEMGIKFAIIPDLDKVDRLTIKVLTRAMLLLPKKGGMTWQWRSQYDVRQSPIEKTEAYILSRSRLLRQVTEIVQPQIFFEGEAQALTVPPIAETKSVTELCVALVLQNYDACLIWAPSLFDHAEHALEARRIFGLALANIDCFEGAVDIWNEALSLSDSLTSSAQFHYLIGLVKSKRLYDADASDDEYQSGLQCLIESSEPEDETALEQAWLLNGLALNQAILWRKTSDEACFKRAFSNIQKAFSLIIETKSPANNYLRFNLIANMAFLMEMAGRFEEAIQVFEKVFRDPLYAAPEQNPRLRGTLSYRMGLLHWKVGDHDRCLSLLTRALEAEEDFGLWSMQDHVLRAQAIILADQNRWSEAIDKFESGLALSLAERCTNGATEHGRGLIYSLIQSGDNDSAQLLQKRLLRTEKLDLLDPGDLSTSDGEQPIIRPQKPASKLPAYIPEIDLEGVPSINLNRFLSLKEHHPTERVAVSA